MNYHRTKESEVHATLWQLSTQVTAGRRNKGQKKLLKLKLYF